MNSDINKLISNYYKGELVSLAFKLISALVIVGTVYILRRYYITDIVVYFSYNVFVIFGVIILKSVYQLWQYFNKRKRLLGNESIDYSLEMDYIRKREALLTYHRRFHVYIVALCCIVIFILILNFIHLGQVIGVVLAILLVSSILLVFSLFNSFRLSEYKFQMEHG